VALYLIMLVALLNHTSFKGNKVLMSLYAIDLGTSPATIGLLYAMYSLFPILLSFYAGKISDRLGLRLPVLLASCGLVTSLLLPYCVPGLAALFAAATLAGISNIFYVVSIQHAVGSHGEGPERMRNYSIFSICVGVTSLVGPVFAGFAIDGVGHRTTFLFLAVLPALTVLALLLFPAMLPSPKHRERRAAPRSVSGLLGNVRLRRVLIATAFLEAGMELFTFLMPIYGRSIGLAASEIGIVMGTFGLALMMVRTVMPALVRRSSEERVFSFSMLMAAIACIGMPFMTSLGPLLAMSFMLGLGVGCGSPLSMVLCYNRSPEGRTGEAIGLRQTVNKSMEAAMPVVFGFLSALLGFTPVYWIGALVLGCGGWLMAHDARRKSVNRDS
jgi:MFS family permease